MDYDWDHIQGNVLTGSPSFADTFIIPRYESGPGDHTVLFIAIDRTGNTMVDPLRTTRSSSSPGPDTPPTIVGAVAATLTTSVLKPPPTQVAGTGIGGSGSATSANRSGLSPSQADPQRLQPGYSRTLVNGSSGPFSSGTGRRAQI
ncbi:MAG: hypothetical protein IMX00_09605 [Limnochordales bacterium]|nr:hypothetical protein [Limnochordales bacterium]